MSTDDEPVSTFVFQDVSTVPLSDHDREHGILVPTPYGHDTLYPPKTADHYIVASVYELHRKCCNGYTTYVPDKVLAFSYTICVEDKCMCDLRTYPCCTWDATRNMWKLKPVSFVASTVASLHRNYRNRYTSANREFTHEPATYPAVYQIVWTVENIKTACKAFAHNYMHFVEYRQFYERQHAKGERGPYNKFIELFDEYTEYQYHAGAYTDFATHHTIAIGEFGNADALIDDLVRQIVDAAPVSAVQRTSLYRLTIIALKHTVEFEILRAERK